MPIDISTFYAFNTVDKQFDEQAYLAAYPEVEQFYQPYCKDNGIPDRQRLFFHYVFYGGETTDSSTKYQKIFDYIVFIQKLIAYAKAKQDNDLILLIKNNLSTLHHGMHQPILCDHIRYRLKLLAAIKDIIDYFPEPKVLIHPKCLE